MSMTAIILRTTGIWRVASCVVAAVLVSAGCSSSAPSLDLGGEDGSKVAQAIEELNEVKHNPKKSEQFFVSKPSPTEAKNLNKYTYYVAGKPSIAGSTATCQVLIEKADGTPVGQQEWTFEKVADLWKIKTAPTP